MADVDKARENRLRAAAQRQGLRLQKSRRQDPLALGYDTYQLVNADTGALVGSTLPSSHHHGAYGLNLDEVERWLTDATRPTSRPPTP